MSESFGGVWVRQWDKTVFWYLFYVFVWRARGCVLGSCMGTQCLECTLCWAPSGCVQQPHIPPVFMQGKIGLTCIPADARKRLKPLSKRQPTHLLCLSLIQFHIQNDKTVYVALWGSIGTTWTIWNWFKWGGLLTESQQLHSWFWRKAGVSSTGCALALDLSLGCKPANAGDMEGPVFDSWNTELSSVSDLYSEEIHR